MVKLSGIKWIFIYEFYYSESYKFKNISRGAKIILLTKEYEIEIDSDEIEIESDFSNVSNTWITKVSFVIDIKEKEIIENRNFEEIEYQFKKEKLRFFAKNKNQLLT